MRAARWFCGCLLVWAMLTCAMACADSELEAVLVAALERQEQRIDVQSFNYSLEEWSAIYPDILHSHPEVFYVAYSSQLIHRATSDTVIAIEPSYRYSGTALQQRRTAFENETERILSLVPDGLSPLEQALFINDLFCVSYSYDPSFTRAYADDLLLEGSGVCDAYTSAYIHILRRLGIEASYVQSEAMVHSWAQIQLDGEWYHVDLVWNDPSPDMPGMASHRFFLLSDAALADDSHQHYAWSAKHAAESTRFDSYFWNDVNSPLVPLNGEWYYTPASYDDGDVYIRAWNPGSLEVRDVFTFQAGWTLWEDARSVWLGAYSGLSARDGRLIYSTATQIWSIYPDATGDTRVFKLPDDAHGYIYALFMFNGETYYRVSTAPDVVGEVFRLT